MLLPLLLQFQPDVLLRYLELQGNDASDVCYDLKYALRLCSEHDLKAACVKIYAVMGLFEEAVDLALQVDIDLPKMHANQCEVEDEVSAQPRCNEHFHCTGEMGRRWSISCFDSLRTVKYLHLLYFIATVRFLFEQTQFL